LAVEIAFSCDPPTLISILSPSLSWRIECAKICIISLFLTDANFDFVPPTDLDDAAPGCAATFPPVIVPLRGGALPVFGGFLGGFGTTVSSLPLCIAAAFSILGLHSLSTAARLSRFPPLTPSTASLCTGPLSLRASSRDFSPATVIVLQLRTSFRPMPLPGTLSADSALPSASAPASPILGEKLEGYGEWPDKTRETDRQTDRKTERHTSQHLIGREIIASANEAQMQPCSSRRRIMRGTCCWRARST